MSGVVLAGAAADDMGLGLETLSLDFAVVVSAGSGTALLSSLFPDECPPCIEASASDCWTRTRPSLAVWLDSAIEAAAMREVGLMARHRARVKVFRPSHGAGVPGPSAGSGASKTQPLVPHSARARAADGTFADEESDDGDESDGLGEAYDVARVPSLRRAALNEIIVHRAPGPSSTYCRITVDGRHLTTVVGDGLVLSTPTGSLGYAAALGAAAVEPSIAGMQVCPVNPYSLAFRPMVLPGSSSIVVQFESARAHRGLTFVVDGMLHPLHASDTVSVTAAPPLRSIVPLDDTPAEPSRA